VSAVELIGLVLAGLAWALVPWGSFLVVLRLIREVGR
jgi:hypothetical protein